MHRVFLAQICQAMPCDASKTSWTFHLNCRLKKTCSPYPHYNHYKKSRWFCRLLHFNPNKNQHANEAKSCGRFLPPPHQSFKGRGRKGTIPETSTQPVAAAGYVEMGKAQGCRQRPQQRGGKFRTIQGFDMDSHLQEIHEQSMSGISWDMLETVLESWKGS